MLNALRNATAAVLITSGVIIGGCGAGGFLAALGCIPCGLIEFVGGVIVGGYFLDLDDDDSGPRPCRNCTQPPPPPPPPPTAPQPTDFCVCIRPNAECAIDGYAWCDYSVGGGNWMYGGPQAIRDPETGFYTGVGIDRMIYPDNGYFNTPQDKNCNQIWAFQNGQPVWLYGPRHGRLLIHFANGDEARWEGTVSPGDKFAIDWSSAAGVGPHSLTLNGMGVPMDKFLAPRE
ncbi:MAG: hypothetical protein R3B52_00335 [Candidatus Paceibacterota bacterium]